MSADYEEMIVKAQKQSPSRHLPSESASSDVIYMSRRAVKDIPQSVLTTTHLKSLYLEGNKILRLPERFFSFFPALVWLDLRNNELRSLPAGVGQHRCLKTLLLEGNPISELPAELGNLITLKALSLRNCPLMFPPQDVVDQGLTKILHYLRSTTSDRNVSACSSQLEVPVVERLQLCDVGCFSLDLCEETGDDSEVQRFQELRHRMVQIERADLEFSDPVQPRTAEGDRGAGTLVLPIIRNKAVRRSMCSDIQSWSRTDEIKVAAMKELKEKQWMLEKRKRAHELLLMQRNQSRITDHHQQQHRKRIITHLRDENAKILLHSDRSSARNISENHLTNTRSHLKHHRKELFMKASETEEDRSEDEQELLRRFTRSCSVPEDDKHAASSYHMNQRSEA